MYVTHAPRTLMFVTFAVVGGFMAGYAIYAMPANAVPMTPLNAAMAPRPNPGVREESKVLQARMAGQIRPGQDHATPRANETGSN
jgi:hypothetical protein